jgi:hypothetical protein
MLILSCFTNNEVGKIMNMSRYWLFILLVRSFRFLS